MIVPTMTYDQAIWETEQVLQHCIAAIPDEPGSDRERAEVAVRVEVSP